MSIIDYAYMSIGYDYCFWFNTVIAVTFLTAVSCVLWCGGAPKTGSVI